MKLHEVPVPRRERQGQHVLLSYGWDGPAPEPGQFLAVRPAGAALDPFLPRPFFFHDFEDGEVTLLIVVQGRGTAILAEAERLLVSDPLGRGFELGGADGPSALFGGGVWISPLRLLSRRLTERNLPHDLFVEVLKSAPNDYDAFASARLPGARLVRTAAEDARDVIERAGDLSRYSTVYASGTTGALAAVREACAAADVRAQLAMRERMACMNGSCYGCAVPTWRDGAKGYVRACVEGPVFRAEELAW